MTHAHTVALIVWVVAQHTLVREGLNEPVERRFGVGAGVEKLREPDRTAELRHAVEHEQRLADGSVLNAVLRVPRHEHLPKLARRGLAPAGSHGPTSAC